MPALAALIPILMAALRLFVVANIAGFIFRGLAALGLYFVVMEPVGDMISGMLEGRIGGAPQVVIEWVGFLQLDVYIQLILSAYTIVWASNFVMRMRPVA